MVIRQLGPAITPGRARTLAHMGEPAGPSVELQVNVLLKEYDALRTEVLARIRSRLELLTVALAGFGLLLHAKHVRPGLVAALALGVVALHTYFGWAIAKINRRLTAVERDVNARMGEDLLQWESRYGSRFFIRLNQGGKRRATDAVDVAGAAGERTAREVSPPRSE
ncbi:MAG: hypothetical protein QOI20_2558 [Acidimicrobiaceae bacterium]|nr:hypothetical protein [Acidimicrobiaceae bacterium]